VVPPAGEEVANTISARRSAGLILTVAVLAVRNVAELVRSNGLYIPVNAATTAALVALARRDGCSWCDLGLAPRRSRSALRLGAVAAAPVAAALAVGAALPVTRRFFDDERVNADAGIGELFYQTGLRIPLGTVLFEEVAFRGVLLALLSRQLSFRAAVAVDGALFGLWHVVPTMANADANDIFGVARVALVAGSVLATAVGGVVFCWLRHRGRHVAAPMVLHLVVNDSSYLLAWWIRSG
jgi:membrane protease YdiL (CAAX protease family)